MTFLSKPTALARKVAKWRQTRVRDREKRARVQQAERRWRAISALVRHRDGNACRVCQVTTIRPGEGNPELFGGAHHIVFRSLGGGDGMGNLLWLCARCHDAAHGPELTITGTADKLKIADKREGRE